MLFTNETSHRCGFPGRLGRCTSLAADIFSRRRQQQIESNAPSPAEVGSTRMSVCICRMHAAAAAAKHSDHDDGRCGCQSGFGGVEGTRGPKQICIHGSMSKTELYLHSICQGRDVVQSVLSGAVPGGYLDLGAPVGLGKSSVEYGFETSHQRRHKRSPPSAAAVPSRLRLSHSLSTFSFFPRRGTLSLPSIRSTVSRPNLPLHLPNRCCTSPGSQLLVLCPSRIKIHQIPLFEALP